MDYYPQKKFDELDTVKYKIKRTNYETIDQKYYGYDF